MALTLVDVVVYVQHKASLQLSVMTEAESEGNKRLHCHVNLTIPLYVF